MLSNFTALGKYNANCKLYSPFKHLWHISMLGATKRTLLFFSSQSGGFKNPDSNIFFFDPSCATNGEIEILRVLYKYYANNVT